MRKLAIVSLLVAVCVTAVLSGCAGVYSPISGTIYLDVKGPLGATSNTGSSKSGTALATSILGIVGTGDASIEAAAKAGGITKIHHVDHHSWQILGVYAKFTTVVYGD